jgi:hypothetical protein
MKKFFITFLLLIVPFFYNAGYAQKIAGFRASRILQSYPNNQFPNSGYWSYVGKQLAQKFDGFNPGGVWIVSLYIGDGLTMFNFPSQGISLPNVSFIGSDQNEEYLTRFDNEGIKVWLQVEPGAANLDTLISIVLNRYKSHPCVAGFGVDVEWLDAQSNNGGRKVTDAEAERWEKKVKSINQNYSLFLKHYSQRWMPPAYRGNILFVDDSQGFTTFNSIISEFKDWGNSFSKNNVAFQYGYAADKPIWGQYSDPMKKIGDELLKQIPNCAALFWVDFTINQLYPVTGVKDINLKERSFNLEQNFPNPFNPSTKIGYQLKEAGDVTIKIYDIFGRELATLFKGNQTAGRHEINFINYDEKLASGTYIYRMVFKDYSESKKFIILK